MATDVEDMKTQKSKAPSLSLQNGITEACEKLLRRSKTQVPRSCVGKEKSVSSLRNYHDNILSSFAEDSPPPPQHTQKKRFVIDKRQRIRAGIAFPDLLRLPI